MSAHYGLNVELLITHSHTPELVGHEAIYDRTHRRSLSCSTLLGASGRTIRSTIA